jgi:hypothetical protein
MLERRLAFPGAELRQKLLISIILPLLMVGRGFASTAASKTLSETDLVRLQAGGVHYGGLSSFAAKFLEHKQILALTGDYARWSATFEQVYYMRLGGQSPWRNWQLRDVDVIEVRAFRAGGRVIAVTDP